MIARLQGLLVVLVVCSFLQGCHTIQGAASGAAQGFKEDWSKTSKVDGWIRENLW